MLFSSKVVGLDISLFCVKRCFCLIHVYEYDSAHLFSILNHAENFQSVFVEENSDAYAHYTIKYTDIFVEKAQGDSFKFSETK